MATKAAVTRHDLHAFLQQPAAANQSLVVLNSESCGAPLLEKLWDASDYVCCADGGANRAHDLLGAGRAPDAVVGDLDSARADVLAAYESRGCAIHRVEDQDSNDLSKALAHVGRRWDAAGVSDGVVRVAGAFGDRFDHELAAVDALYRFGAQRPKARCVLHGDSTAAILLGAGAHEIRVRRDVEGPHCGLIPVGGAVRRVTTTGLTWNLSGQRLAFGELVSSSNLLQDDLVSIETSDPVLWTVEVCVRIT